MQVNLQKFVPGGQTIGILPDGKKVFVWGGLPNETVEIEITKSKKSYAEGIAKDVLTANAHRIKPRDDCYLSTSPWQIMDYNYELEQKKTLIIEAFSQENIDIKEDFSIETDGNQYRYRNKMEYSLWWDNETNKISLAFHKRGTHRKIPIEKSSIEIPEIFDEAEKIISDLNDRGEEARKYQSLMLRANQHGEVSGGLLENYKPHPQFKPLTDTIIDRGYTYSPNGFFQINIPVYEMVLKEVKQHIDKNLPVVDMYAGVGTIGLSVINKNQPLTLVETDKNAFEEMKKNIESLVDVDAKPVLSNAEDALKYIISDINLIVDPPRAGLDSKIIDQILKTLPKSVTYLSCNPTTQARDVAKLLTKYRISHLKSYNFFPRTPHIENLVVLERK